MDVTVTLLILLGAAAVVLVSLIGALVFYVSESRLKRWMPLLIAVAVGVLLGDAFLHLIPDAMEMAPSSESSVALWVLIGVLSFVFLESCLQWRHDHATINAPKDQGEKDQGEKDREEIASFARMNLCGDGAHNFVDGVLIASSFLADPALGLATTIAIVLHEVPQEISDIAVLIQGGFSRRNAVLLNVLCATACIPGALVTILFSQLMELNLSAMLAFTAGGFIYIATSDLVPLLRSEQLKASIPVQFASTMIGIMSMQAILWWEGANLL